MDSETGKIDIDRIGSTLPASQRSNIAIIREVINELEGIIGKTVPTDDIIKEAKERGIDESKTEDVLERLKRSGDLFSPKSGFVSKI